LDGSLDDTGAEQLGYDDWLCCEMRDGPGNDARTFSRIVESLTLMVGGTPPVLVHCHAGRSRSIAVVAGYLVRREDMAPRAAFDYIAQRREIAVQPELVTLVEQLAARWLKGDRL
jgi:protein-tyrosine phosphatase